MVIEIGKVYKVVCTVLNIRFAPDINAPVVGELNYGDEVEILEKYDKWVRVGENEWVHSDYISNNLPSGGFTPYTESEETFIKHLSFLMQIDYKAALAVFQAESGGQFYNSQNKPIIRFENHVFKDQIKNDELYYKYFRNNSEQVWTGHQVNFGDGQWKEFHGNQEMEYKVLRFAEQFNDVAAYNSISMGAAQLMGFHHSKFDFIHPRQLWEYFNESSLNQILGFFVFIRYKNLIEHIQTQNFYEFAKVYNGSGQAQNYASIIQSIYNRI